MDEDVSYKLFRLVRRGRVGRLQSHIARTGATFNDSSCSLQDDTTAAVVYLLASVVDKRGRRLLHVACEHGQVDMLQYLVELDLPVEVCDGKGNTPVHACAKYGLRHRRYAKCCKLLVCLLEKNLELLYVRNNAGVSPSNLLEDLWRLASPKDRDRGDSILLQCRGLEEDIYVGLPARRHFDEATDETLWHNRLVDELDADLPSHDNYFSGFADHGCQSGDHFEDIRKEYEHRRHQKYNSTHVNAGRAHRSENTTSATANANAEFHHRHNESLRKRGLFAEAVVGESSSVSYDNYNAKWQAFLKNTSATKIPWPPIKLGDIESLMQFVGHNLVHLRQLQIDWHPDRFFRRLSSTIERTPQIVDRITALSQFFNAGVAEIRQKKNKEGV